MTFWGDLPSVMGSSVAEAGSACSSFPSDTLILRAFLFAPNILENCQILMLREEFPKVVLEGELSYGRMLILSAEPNFCRVLQVRP